MKNKAILYILIFTAAAAAAIAAFVLYGPAASDGGAGSRTAPAASEPQQASGSDESEGPQLDATDQMRDKTGAPGPYLTTGTEASHDNFFIEGTVTSLDSLLDAEKNATVVWISASWCEICHAMRPFVWISANKFADRVALVEIDHDANPDIIRSYAVFGSPSFLVFNRQGEVAFRFSGANQDAFESYLAQASNL